MKRTLQNTASGTKHETQSTQNEARSTRFHRSALFLLLLVALALSLSAPAPASADWSVTVTWNRSAGPGLDYEQALLDGAVKCTVQETESTSCNFVVPALANQGVVIRSYNAQGAYSETTPVVLSAVPVPATGVMVNITYLSP